MPNSSDQHDNNAPASFALSDLQKHDLKAALLSIKWASELLEPVDGSEPPCTLVAAQLRQSYVQLSSFIAPFLVSNGNPST
ncbi:MAG: hypothetical protein RI932_639 [Pseudomonadota bacterium]|jgi:hypothetical protein